jgi:type IV pilus assembly protein PilA
MRPELKAKFIQHLNRKKADQGFTLIELLVVIVIIGILAAIAIPNFLSQTAKARQSEAKQNVSLINKAQVNKRMANNGLYGTSFDEIAIGSLKGSGATDLTPNYSYTLTVDNGATGADTARINAAARDTSTKNFNAGVVRYINNSNNSATESIICIGDVPGAAVAAVTLNKAATDGGAACPAASKALQNANANIQE